MLEILKLMLQDPNHTIGTVLIIAVTMGGIVQVIKALKSKNKEDIKTESVKEVK